LWKTDGTTNGTVRVTDLSAKGGFTPANLTSFNNALYFTAQNADSISELWLTNGTTAGTKRLVEAGLSNQTLRADLLDDEGDGQITAADGAASAANSVQVDLSTVSGNDLIHFDLTSLVQKVLTAGKTRLTIRLQLSGASTEPLSIYFPADASHQTGIDVTTARQPGVLADLYD